MPEHSRNVKKARSPRRANEDFLHPSQGSASSYRSSRRGSDATLSESIGCLDDDDEDAPGESEDEDEDQAEVDFSTMTPAERLAYKRRMKRFRLNHNQTRFLLSEFARQQHPDAAHRARLSQEIPGLSPRQVQVWFQNRRAKLKRLPSDEQSQVMENTQLGDEDDQSKPSLKPTIPRPQHHTYSKNADLVKNPQGSRALPPEYLAAQAQSFRRIEPTHPHNAYTSSLTVDPSTLKPPNPPSVSLTPPTYTHSPISAHGSSTHASPIIPKQSDDFWSPNPYTQPSLVAGPGDMLHPQHQTGGYPPSTLLSYPPSDFSRSRSASLTGAGPAAPAMPSYESSSSSYTTQQREYYSPAHRTGIPPTTTTPTPQPWPPHHHQASSAQPPPRRPSAQYLSSLTHSHPPQPGFRVDENEYGYRRARAGSGDSLFVTTMEELRINPTVQAEAVVGGAGFGGTQHHQQQQGGGFETGGYEGDGSGGGGYYGDLARQGMGRGEGRGRRMG